MIRRLFTLLLVLGGEVGSFILMLRVPAGTLDEIPNLPPEDAVLVVVRLVALAVAGWLTASTMLYGLASATRLPALLRGVQWLTLPGIRRLVDGLVTTTVIATATLSVPGAASAMPSASLGAGLAAPAAPPSLYVPRPAGDGISARSPIASGRATSHTYRPQPAGGGLVPSLPPRPEASATPAYSPRPAGDSDPLSPSAPAGQPTVPTPVPPAPPPPAPVPSTSTYVLRSGDHLWSVAARHVAGHLGVAVQDLSTAEIGRYWIRLVDLNWPHLRSGDPDVVYPGEVITLPAL